VYLIAAPLGSTIDPITKKPVSCIYKPESKCSSGDCSHQAGTPIYLDTGNTYIKDTDVSLPGLGGGITLQRTWNSVLPQNLIDSSIGIFGPNWKSSYEERIFTGSDHYIRYARGDGSYWVFGLNASGALAVAAPADVSVTLSQTVSNWILSFMSGELRQFSLTTGMLTAIVDRNGNTTQLTYDTSGRITTVTDPASRHLYFSYSTTSPNLVSSVTSDFGVTLSYSYDSTGRLTQVTKPDLSTINYTYNGQSLITQVTDANAKVLETHTYDSNGRGVSSSQANGVNSLTVAYPPLQP
jgi:YD repeat-containing protein